MNKTMRRIFAIMALVSILLLLGVVGGVDAGTMPLKQGALLCFLCVGALIGSTWLAGGFEEGGDR